MLSPFIIVFFSVIFVRLFFSVMSRREKKIIINIAFTERLDTTSYHFFSRFIVVVVVVDVMEPCGKR